MRSTQILSFHAAGPLSNVLNISSSLPIYKITPTISVSRGRRTIRLEKQQVIDDIFFCYSTFVLKKLCALDLLLAYVKEKEQVETGIQSWTLLKW